MGNITGINTAVEIGFEVAGSWGDAVVPTFKPKHISESLTWEPEYKNEETLIGNVTDEDSDLVGCTVGGDLVVWARPGVIGKLLAAALGQDAVMQVDTSTAYKHTITCLPPGVNNSLPSLTVIVDRHVAIKAYSGMKIGTVKLESAPKDYVKATFTMKGKNEAGGALQSLTPSALKAYKFADGAITVDGSDFSGNVKGFSIGVENNLDEGDPSLASGIYNTEPETQKRKITVSLETTFNTDIETFRNSKLVGGAYANIELTLTSAHEIESGYPYKMVVKLPRVRVLKASPNAGDSNKINVSIEGEAYETNGTAPITIESINVDDAAYV